MDERNDGLLRGSRQDRVGEMLVLSASQWNLHTLLDLHCGLLDHTEDVRLAALEALMEITKLQCQPLTISPISMLLRFMFSFTATSGATPNVFRFLIDLGTAEARTIVKQIMESAACSNSDFKEFVNAIPKSKDASLLDHLMSAKLSKAKSRILDTVLKCQTEKGKD